MINWLFNNIITILIVCVLIYKAPWIYQMIQIYKNKWIKVMEKKE